MTLEWKPESATMSIDTKHISAYLQITSGSAEFIVSYSTPTSSGREIFSSMDEATQFVEARNARYAVEREE